MGAAVVEEVRRRAEPMRCTNQDEKENWGPIPDRNVRVWNPARRFDRSGKPAPDTLDEPDAPEGRAKGLSGLGRDHNAESCRVESGLKVEKMRSKASMMPT